jgi:hypothetical protein
MKQINAEVLSTMAGVSTLVGLGITGTPIALTSLAGIGVYLGFKMLLFTPNEKLTITYKTTDTNIQKSIDMALTSLEKINTTNQNVKNQVIKTRLNNIVQFGTKVIDVLSDEFNAVTILKDLTKLFDRFAIVITKYIELNSHEDIKYAKKDTALNNFEELLYSLEVSLEHFYKQGLKSDISSFEAEMQVISQKIKTSNGMD